MGLKIEKRPVYVATDGSEHSDLRDARLAELEIMLRHRAQFPGRPGDKEASLKAAMLFLSENLNAVTEILAQAPEETT